MVKILPYDPKIEVVWATPEPEKVVGLACSTTQKGIFTKDGNSSPALIEFLHTAEHGNPLEHAVICLNITQISRACADQLRTHRTCSPTMSSTHYQHHGNYPHRVSHDALQYETLLDSIKCAMGEYEWAIQNDLAKEDARQFLPLSIEVRYMLTINARSLAHFIQLRSCYRNTIETILCADRIRDVAVEWFPQLFTHVGRRCAFGECKEGKMRCSYLVTAEKLAQYV